MMAWTEATLDKLLTTPSAGLVEDMKKLKGDIMILGAGGKMGPTLAVLAKNAVKAAGTDKRVIAVSRFSDPFAVKFLEENGVETISADLLADGALEKLPDIENIIYMAGRKFGTGADASATWVMNTSLPTLVARRFKGANITVFSTGNVYPMVEPATGGCSEDVPVSPIGEYAMSCLGRERVFEQAAREFGTKVLMYRLNYAVDLRYGVLYDLASKILAEESIDLATPAFNCIWQGYANEAAIRSLLHAESPAAYLNVTGPETVSVRFAAEELGKALGKAPVFTGEPGEKALLNNAGKCMELFGYPEVSLKKLIRWQAEWLQSGGRTLNKPTHFEERSGKF